MTITQYDRITLGRQAKELGFVRDTFESDIPGGAYASATAYTMAEMTKAHGLNVEMHLTFLL